MRRRAKEPSPFVNSAVINCPVDSAEKSSSPGADFGTSVAGPRLKASASVAGNPRFGQAARGPIGLQFWGGDVAHHNLRIRPL
jgi:hypothetical protein